MGQIPRSTERISSWGKRF